MIKIKLIFINLMIVVSLVLMFLMICFLMSGCYIIKNYNKTTPECEIYYNTLGITKQGDPDKCYNSISYERCKKDIFQNSVLDFNDSVKYRNFNECLKELQ